MSINQIRLDCFFLIRFFTSDHQSNRRPLCKYTRVNNQMYFYRKTRFLTATLFNRRNVRVHHNDRFVLPSLGFFFGIFRLRFP